MIILIIEDDGVEAPKIDYEVILPDIEGVSPAVGTRLGKKPEVVVVAVLDLMDISLTLARAFHSHARQRSGMDEPLWQHQAPQLR